MFLLVLFGLGASVGSFLNVCIWRLPRGESIVQPPSHCPKCDARLKAIDLVPLISQVALKARCRSCGAPISWRYFGIEFLTGVLFVLVGAQQGFLDQGSWSGAFIGNPARLLQGLIFVSTLVVIFWVDYETRLIQLEAVFLLGLAGLLADVWGLWDGQKTLMAGVLPDNQTWLPAPLPESVIALVAVAFGLWLLREGFSLLYGKEALGFGDVILVGAIAANLGWNATIFTFFFLSVVVGASVGVMLQIPRAARAYRWAKARERRLISTFHEPSTESGFEEENGEASPVAEQPEAVPPIVPQREEIARSARSLAWPLARHAFRKAIPFGPMLAIGAVVAMLYGTPLNEAYLNWLRAAYAPPAAQVLPRAPDAP